MKYLSTRPGAPPIGIRAALEAGLAPDGGLYVPERFPILPEKAFAHAETMADIGSILLKPFFEDDEILGPALPGICRKAFDFPVPLTAVPGRDGDFILELFHGPTAAFKDIGARFLAECVTVLSLSSGSAAAGRKRTVIVATSGDTGGAVAAAFHGKPGTEVLVLFPKGRISARQEKQLTAWGGNVRAFAMEGPFDDCQRVVKEALLHPPGAGEPDRAWLSANSINLGRVLPQMVYYARASLAIWRASGKRANFIIPSGNLGNSLAALWAKRIGLPIDQVVLALNANRPVADYFTQGTYLPARTIATLANAMDVGNPSNLERLRTLFPTIQQLRAHVRAECVSDAEIQEEIRSSEMDWGQPLCPHTATAAVVRKRMKELNPVAWVLVATAHPAKFESIVEPLIGRSLELPEALRAILTRPSHYETLAPSLGSLLEALNGSAFT